MRRIVWLGTSKDELKSFPNAARQLAGYQLGKIQQGGNADDWKPMPDVGIGVREIRVRDSTGAFRVLYAVRFGDAVYVLHAFQKKSQATRRSDLELARERFKSIARVR
jgi:phage-related protein